MTNASILRSWHMRLPHRLQGQKVKSQKVKSQIHRAGAYRGGHLAAQLVMHWDDMQIVTATCIVAINASV